MAPPEFVERLPGLERGQLRDVGVRLDLHLGPVVATQPADPGKVAPLGIEQMVEDLADRPRTGRVLNFLAYVAEDGSILRELTLDPERGYQPVGQQARSTMS